MASAPASSANLGPGFDFLALALELRCRVTLEPADEWTVPAEAASIVTGVVAALGIEHAFTVSVESDIPIGRGLGSSAALAVAAGAAAAAAEGRRPDPGEVFAAAAAVEGHPDNAAAAVYGGLVAVSPGRPHQFSMAPQLVPVLGVPDATLLTTEARRALPDTLTHAAAARSAARAAFLVEGLRTGDRDALAAAQGDELHEGPRAHLSAITNQLVDAALGAGAVYASWSGAGPSALALTTAGEADAIAAAMDTVLKDGGVVLRPEVARRGYELGA